MNNTKKNRRDRFDLAFWRLLDAIEHSSRMPLEIKQEAVAEVLRFCRDNSYARKSSALMHAKSDFNRPVHSELNNLFSWGDKFSLWGRVSNHLRAEWMERQTTLNCKVFTSNSNYGTK